MRLLCYILYHNKLTLGACANAIKGYSSWSVCVCLSVQTKSASASMHVRVLLWCLIKTYGLKVVTTNTFHGDPRQSLWRWTAQAGRSHVERQV